MLGEEHFVDWVDDICQIAVEVRNDPPDKYRPLERYQLEDDHVGDPPLEGEIFTTHNNIKCRIYQPIIWLASVLRN